MRSVAPRSILPDCLPSQMSLHSSSRPLRVEQLRLLGQQRAHACSPLPGFEPAGTSAIPQRHPARRPSRSASGRCRDTASTACAVVLLRSTAIIAPSILPARNRKPGETLRAVPAVPSRSRSLRMTHCRLCPWSPITWIASESPCPSFELPRLGCIDRDQVLLALASAGSHTLQRAPPRRNCSSGAGSTQCQPDAPRWRRSQSSTRPKP